MHWRKVSYLERYGGERFNEEMAVMAQWVGLDP
jgi:hypothetical protein